MASILDRYGIKEVADVTFYDIDPDTGKPSHPVLYLDTLKVSTIEQTAESTEARGGKGNAALISWDYGKEINVTLEDALFSAKSMAIMFGNGKGTALGNAYATDATTTNANNIMRTEIFVATANGTGVTNATTAIAAGWKQYIEGPNGKQVEKKDPKFYTEDGNYTTTLTKDTKYFCTYDLEGKDAYVIEVSANSFPGTYYVTGDTYARSETSGKDEFFQFIIPKAKVTSENTITLEAEGDPSVFNMSLKVLRPEDGVMMKLVKYGLTESQTDFAGTESTWIHNHHLSTDTTNT